MTTETLFPFTINGVTHYMSPDLFNDLFSHYEDERYMYMTEDGFVITYNDL